MSDISPPPPPSGFPTDPKEAKAQAKAAKAHAKAIRPWYKKKRYIALLAIVALFAISLASSGSDDNKASTNTTADGSTETTAEKSTETTATTSGDEASKTLFPGRADAQNEDQERNIGESAKLSGYTGTVTSAGFQQKVSDFEDGGYVVIEVTIENRDDKAQAYNTFDWRLQTPNGQVIDPGFTSNQTLGSGDLVSGGKVSGKVVFEVGDAKGDFYIIYKPDAFDAARGIWKVTVS